MNVVVLRWGIGETALWSEVLWTEKISPLSLCITKLCCGLICIFFLYTCLLMFIRVVTLFLRLLYFLILAICKLLASQKEWTQLFNSGKRFTFLFFFSFIYLVFVLVSFLLLACPCTKSSLVNFLEGNSAVISVNALNVINQWNYKMWIKSKYALPDLAQNFYYRMHVRNLHGKINFESLLQTDGLLLIGSQIINLSWFIGSGM